MKTHPAMSDSSIKQTPHWIITFISTLLAIVLKYKKEICIEKSRWNDPNSFPPKIVQRIPEMIRSNEQGGYVAAERVSTANGEA